MLHCSVENLCTASESHHKYEFFRPEFGWSLQSQEGLKAIENYEYWFFQACQSSMFVIINDTIFTDLRRLGGIEGPNAGRTVSSRTVTLVAARFASFLESKTVSATLEVLANTFPGQGNSGGSDQPPAFVAAEIARSTFSIFCYLPSIFSLNNTLLKFISTLLIFINTLLILSIFCRTQSEIRVHILSEMFDVCFLPSLSCFYQVSLPSRVQWDLQCWKYSISE